MAAHQGLVHIVSNPNHGGSSGTDFTLTNGNFAVKTLNVWIAKGSNGWSDRDLVKAIEIVWTENTDITVQGSKTDATQHSFTFHDGETVTSMDLWTGDRVDKISFTTSENRTFTQGGTGGTQYSQQIGIGVLFGFKGSYNSDELVSIGSVFKESSD